MSDAPQVDLSQIRGDWHFHLNYLTNAINQSLVRAQKMWREVKDEVNDATIGKFVDQLGDSWARLEATGNDKDRIDVKQWHPEKDPETGQWKPHDYFDLKPDGRFQLYNLKTDPKEERNLADKHPELVRELHGLLNRYRKNGRSTP